MLGYYNRDGEPITMEQWGMLRASDNYYRVAQDQVGPYWVSTVWLGLDHSFTPIGPPIIFESMVFAASEALEGLGPDMECQRYATEAEARKGHDELVTLLRATTTDVDDAVREEEGHEHG